MAVPADSSGAPFVLVPSFDSSVLEFRRLLPLLEARRRTWAVDLVGWGFTDVSFADSSAPLGPVQKREHLYALWKDQVTAWPLQSPRLAPPLYIQRWPSTSQAACRVMQLLLKSGRTPHSSSLQY